MSLSRLIPLARKELIHIVRDPRSIVVIFALPLFMIFLYGYAIDLNLKNIRLGVADLSSTPASRSLVESFAGSEYFTVRSRLRNAMGVEELLRRRAVRAAVVIPRDYAERLESDGAVEIGVYIDGSDANSASIVQNYIETVLASHSASLSSASSRLLLSVRPLVLYNPEMSSTHFIVPGLIAIVMMMLGALLTSVTIAREKETGTLEQILVSPIRPLEVVVGKVIPYLFLAFAIAMAITLFGHFHFGVPVVGSWLLLMLFCVVYLFTSLALGLLISTFAATQQVAMMFSSLITILPSIMLSGFVFPISSMALPLRMLSKIVPATHFLVIIRGVMLKGNGFGELWREFVILIAIGLFFMAIAAKRFNLKLSVKR